MWPGIEISLNRPRIIDYYRSVWPGGAALAADAVLVQAMTWHLRTSLIWRETKKIRLLEVK